MSTSIPASINPALLTWARESAGYTLDEASSKARVKPERLQAWEEHGQLTVAQLRKMAQIYKRALALFFLPEPPAIQNPVQDFRRTPDHQERIAPQLQFEIRRAILRRDILLEIVEDNPDIEEARFSPPAVRLNDDPEQIAAFVRDWLGLTYEIQLSWKQSDKAFHWWRDALEIQGILVFQFSNVSVAEARGFSISQTRFPIIGINAKDSPQGKIFSLLHELAHILLNESGLCVFDEHNTDNAIKFLEIFCNRVAGSTLAPKKYIELEEVVADNIGNSVWNDEDIEVLTRRYQASNEVILRRLLTLNYITKEVYNNKKKEFDELYKKIDAEAKKRKVIILPHMKAINKLGSRYIKNIINGYHQNNITSSTLSEALGIGLNYLPMLEQKIYHR